MKFIKKFLFHRIVFLTTAVLLQLVVIIGVILKFNDYFIFFYGASIFISAIAVFKILNNHINPAYKITWIILILLFPIFGGLFYVFFGRNKLGKRGKRKMKSIEDKTKTALPHAEFILDEMKALSEDSTIQSRYIQNFAYFPPYHNEIAEYLSIGEQKFERLKDELRKAERYIFLEYFIIEDGIMWSSILEILEEKASKGVDVRVIYDDVGCLFTLPYKYDKGLERMGIKCCVFNPLVPMLFPILNNRDHRKIAIIDGHTGFTGGINLADEYINKLHKYGHWKDSSILIKGEAVWSMTVMFLSMWGYLKGIQEDFNRFKAEGKQLDGNEHDGFIQPYADSPLDEEAVGEIVYLNIINKARRYVYITTPYLIIDNEMVTALTAAAKGGVDIRIITPHCGDKWYVHSVTRSYYKGLIDSGVRIYEYTPGFIHSKTYVSDDEYGVVGTINMDYRRSFLHFECGVWMYKCRVIDDVKRDFLETLKVCKEISRDDFKNIKWYKALGRTILRVFAPLM